MGSDQVLVPGGTGFIGRYVVRALLARSIPLRVLTRQASRARKLFQDQVEIMEGDLTCPVATSKAVEGCTSLINVAGCYEFGPSSAGRLRAANVDGVRNLLQAWSGQSGRFVHVSTAGFWEQGKDGSLTHVRLPGSAYYKRTKANGERAVLEAAASGMDAVVVNPTCPVGAEDHQPTPTGRIVHDFMRGRFPVGCRTGVNLIHVADLADGIVQAWVKAPPGGPVILGDENLWMDEIFSRCQQWVDRRKPAIEAPHWLIWLMGEIGEAADHCRPGFSRQSQLCRETAWLSRRAQFFDLKTIHEQIDWKPSRGVDAGLHDAIRFFRGDHGAEQISAAHSNVS